jgi:hypothetical protein
MSFETTEDLHRKYKPKLGSYVLTGNDNGWPGSVSKDVDYEPHPERSLKLSPEDQCIADAFPSLNSGSASEEDMQVYDEKAIYDDP